MARMTLIDYLRDEAPNALIGVTPPTKPVKGSASYQAMSPAERQAYDSEWDY